MNQLCLAQAKKKKSMDAPLPYAHHAEEACMSHRFVTKLVDRDFLYKATNKTGLAFDFL